MKIFVVLACALALATAKNRRIQNHHQDLKHKASDYGEQVAYSGHAGHHGGVGVPVSQLVAHEDVQIGGYSRPLQLHPLGHGHGHGHGNLYDAGRIKHSHAIVDYQSAGGLEQGLGLIDGPGGHPGPANLIGNPLDLPSEISKSVFVFSAPPDPSDVGPRTVISRVPYARPQKHYQVVFINAPTPPPPPQHKLELPPHPELKTLVYVLVKKPEKPKPIKVIKPLPKPPTKPEVYFIRYMNKHHHLHGHGHGEPPFGEIPHDYPVAIPNGPAIHTHHDASHYGPPGGPLGEPMGPDYVDESYAHAHSENRPRYLPPAELHAGVSGI